MSTACGAGDFLHLVLAYVARELQLWRHACQLSYEDPYVVLTSMGKKNGLGSACTECCTFPLTLRSLDCALINLANLLGVAWLE